MHRKKFKHRPNRQTIGQALLKIRRKRFDSDFPASHSECIRNATKMAHSNNFKGFEVGHKRANNFGGVSSRCGRTVLLQFEH